jgi:hypothetical protein
MRRPKQSIIILISDNNYIYRKVDMWSILTYEQRRKDALVLEGVQTVSTSDS